MSAIVPPASPSQELTKSEPCLLEHLQNTENDSEDKAKDYCRYNFLLYHNQSVQTEGNDKLFIRLKDNHTSTGQDSRDDDDLEEVERWDHWKSYPNFEDMSLEDDLAEQGQAMEFLSWLIGTFGPCVCFWREEKADSLPAKSFGLDDLTVDDIAFIFLQVQHNIDKWKLLHHAIQNKTVSADSEEKSMTGHEKKVLQKMNEMGYEYKNGSGVSGTEGKKRYSGITKFIHKAFYSNLSNDKVKKNREALKEAVDRVREEARHRLSFDSGDTVGNHDKNKKPKCKEQTPDPVMDDIQDELWDDIAIVRV